jgi:hypothetical protein
MQLTCSKCGVRDARVSHPQNILEQVKAWLGIYQLRCRRCKKRWETSVWSDGAWKYARCPRCYRQELTTWSEQYYHSPRWTTIRLRLGATPYRCAACRCNFASFKECKERFMWRHSTRVDVAPSESESLPPGEATEPTETIHSSPQESKTEA